MTDCCADWPWCECEAAGTAPECLAAAGGSDGAGKPAVPSPPFAPASPPEPQLELLALPPPPPGLGELPTSERVEVRRHTRRRRRW